jgi:putative Holliday junction resolvase
MRVLGIDYGRVRLGLAMSDEDGILATPLPHLRRTRSADADVRRLVSLATRNNVGRIVVGLPLQMDGAEGAMAEEARGFAERIEREAGIPVTLVDERLTSAEAERVLIEGDVSRKRRKGLRDSLAAVLILQVDLDRQRTADGRDPSSEEQDAATSSPRGADTP